MLKVIGPKVVPIVARNRGEEYFKDDEDESHSMYQMYIYNYFLSITVTTLHKMRTHIRQPIIMS